MDSLKHIHQTLEKDSLFLSWKKEHQDAFLSHFFMPITNPINIKKDGWEIGYFSPQKVKITVFNQLENGSFAIKPADDVFAQKPQDVSSLDLSKVSMQFSQVLDKVKEDLQKLFPAEISSGGFVVLQNFKGKDLWNFSFITKSLQFANVKLDATTGDVISHELISVISQ